MRAPTSCLPQLLLAQHKVFRRIRGNSARSSLSTILQVWLLEALGIVSREHGQVCRASKKMDQLQHLMHQDTLL